MTASYEPSCTHHNLTSQPDILETGRGGGWGRAGPCVQSSLFLSVLSIPVA